jgi:CubicO group peptidase (beta-lactamase class C family)
VAWTDDAGRASTPASAALPRSSPERQGISSAAILDFVDAADRRIEQMHSVMILRHGHVVAEGWWAPYSADTPHTMFSLTKSFTSTGVGLAIAEGRMSLDDPVLSFFPDEAPAEPSEKLKSMRVRDLLSMSTGHEKEAPWQSEANWARAFLAQPVPHKPGTHFLYNTPASYMLSAIVQKVTGAPLVGYLRPRLFEPLGIEGLQWDTNGEGVTIGGYGLHLRTEDVARFGQLYLQKGLWRGKRLLPAEWVEAATARQTSNGSNPASDWDQGYGYQFWRCRHGAYRGDGAFGQYCIVMPAQDAVVVITSGVKDMQSVMNLVWERLLPAMQPKPLAPDQVGRRRLGERLARLAVPPQSGAASSHATGYIGKTYSFPSNERRLESIALESDALSQEMTLVARVGGSEQRLACGSAGWRKGRLAYGGPEQPVAASGAWTADDTYSAKVCFYETPFCVTMALRFGADGLTFDSESNVAFGSTKHPTLPGTLATPSPGAAPAAGSADAASDVR